MKMKREISQKGWSRTTLGEGLKRKKKKGGTEVFRGERVDS